MTRASRHPLVATWNAYVNAALQHGGFIPQPGQTVAVLLYVDGLESGAIQDQIIEVTVPAASPPPGCSGSIGQVVYNDRNGSGAQDDGEPGIVGITVKLYKGAVMGSPRATTVTGISPAGYPYLPEPTAGYYQFPNLCSGTYFVVAGSNPPTAAIVLSTNHTIDLSSNIGINGPPVLTCGANTGQAGVAYSSQLTATSGTTPYNFSASGLPGWLTLNAASGALSGTPPGAGTFSFMATVVDARGSPTGTAVGGCSITVVSACPTQ